MLATTPNNPSKRKQICKMSNAELIEETNFHRHSEVALKDASSGCRKKYSKYD